MSRASEWAGQPHFITFVMSERAKATVLSAEGKPLLLVDGDLLTAEEALDLARWIIDTFAEPPA